MMQAYENKEIADTVNYSCHPKVTWVVETHGLLLIHHALDKSLRLEYPEAAVWDFVSQGYEYSRMVYLVAKIASIEREECDSIIRNCLEKLIAQNFLLKSK